MRIIEPFKLSEILRTSKSRQVSTLVLVLLYFVWICGFYYGVFHVESCLTLCSRVFQSCLALWSPRLGKTKLVYMYVLLVHTFVYSARVNICYFSLTRVFMGWLQLVIVALLGLFYQLFENLEYQHRFKEHRKTNVMAVLKYTSDYYFELVACPWSQARYGSSVGCASVWYGTVAGSVLKSDNIILWRLVMN